MCIWVGGGEYKEKRSVPFFFMPSYFSQQKLGQFTVQGMVKENIMYHLVTPFLFALVPPSLYPILPQPCPTSSCIISFSKLIHGSSSLIYGNPTFFPLDSGCFGAISELTPPLSTLPLTSSEPPLHFFSTFPLLISPCSENYFQAKNFPHFCLTSQEQIQHNHSLTYSWTFKTRDVKEHALSFCEARLKWYYYSLSPFRCPIAGIESGCKG